MTDIISAIIAINPKAEVSVNGEDYNQITWHNGTTPISEADIKAKQAEQKMLLARADKQAKLFKEAREYENPGFQWTRRIIALTAVFAIVLFPKLLPLLQPLNEEAPRDDNDFPLL